MKTIRILAHAMRLGLYAGLSAFVEELKRAEEEESKR